ncbi:MAG: hypothetical protein Q9196_005049, partial [Gyalolechia fulgens]
MNNMWQPKVLVQLFCIWFSFPIFVWPISSGNTNGLLDVVNSHGSQLLNHSYLVQYPLSITTASVESLNTLDLCNGVVIEEASIDDLQRYMSDDSERVAGHVRGPLHGIPFMVKDNIASKDRLETTAGSLALRGSVVPRDAFVVARLREAGAVLLGKTTLSEWADARSSNYSEGYSATGGQARSSYNLTVNPGGSSSGSAIAVANNIVAFALGTETDGSVINPAERNAIVGVKPTVGLVSRAGVVPESLHQDTVGVFARTVRDAVHALDAIYGVDTLDNYTSAQVGNTPKDRYGKSLSDRSALRGAKLGLPWLSFWALADPEQQAILLALVELIKDAGATIINGTEIPNYQTIISPTRWNWDYGTTRGYPNESEYTYIKVDFYNNLQTYLSELGNTTIRSIEDVVRFNNEHARAEGAFPNLNPAFASGQDLLLATLATGGVMNSTYWEALTFCQESTREKGIDAALQNGNDNLDALLVPPDVGQSYQIAAQAGYPVITLPAYIHSLSGMPFGLALMGTAFSEATLVKYASAIEDLQKVSKTEYRRTRPQWLGR